MVRTADTAHQHAEADTLSYPSNKTPHCRSNAKNPTLTPSFNHRIHVRRAFMPLKFTACTLLGSPPRNGIGEPIQVSTIARVILLTMPRRQTVPDLPR